MRARRGPLTGDDADAGALPAGVVGARHLIHGARGPRGRGRRHRRRDGGYEHHRAAGRVDHAARVLLLLPLLGGRRRSGLLLLLLLGRLAAMLLLRAAARGGWGKTAEGRGGSKAAQCVALTPRTGSWDPGTWRLQCTGAVLEDATKAAKAPGRGLDPPALTGRAARPIENSPTARHTSGCLAIQEQRAACGVEGLTAWDGAGVGGRAALITDALHSPLLCNSAWNRWRTSGRAVMVVFTRRSRVCGVVCSRRKRS